MSSRVGAVLLGIGALAGVVLAGVSLLERDPAVEELPPDVVAVVDGQPIRRAAYERALRAVAADRRGAVTDADRRRVLDRLVDEELLVQRGLELGLARRDRRVRADLSAAVIALVTTRAEEETADVTEEELRAFFEAHREVFRRPPRLHVDQLFYRVGPEGDEAARRRATEALERWREGAAREALRPQADRFDVPLPDGPLPLTKLRDYVGPTVVRGVAEAGEGDIVGPLRSGNGYHLVRVVTRRRGQAPAFEEVRPQVRAEHRRRLGERRLRELLEERREAVDVRIAQGVL